MPATLTSLLSQPPWTGKGTLIYSFPLEPPSIDYGPHGTEKLLLKAQVSEDFA